VVGAIVIPGAVMTLLALLPWLDRARSRGLHDRRWLLSAMAAGVAAITTLTVMGAMDKPPASDGSWNIREQAGLALMSDTTCTACHGETAMAGPIDPMRVAKPRDWISGHLLDPQMIAPGLREAPPTNQYDNEAILAALARGRSGSQPALAAEDGHVAVLFNRNCLRCHQMGAVGGDEGPELTTIGDRLNEGDMSRLIADPLSLKPLAEMPAFGDKLSGEDIATLARWLGRTGVK
jgi:mono/diheme cytochrome c family protein